MENNINIAALLKECPKGMELDCLLCNSPIALEGVAVNESKYPIKAVCKDGFIHVLTKYGTIYNHDDAKCVIFPKGKTTWEGFVPPCKFKDGDIISDSLGTCIFKGEGVIQGTVDYYCCTANYFFVKQKKDGHCGNIIDYRFATEEEKEKLFKAIKDNGYKWNAETKTLEKLIEPKFKVGDKVQHKGATSCGTVYEIEQIKWEDDQVKYIICDLYWKNCKCTVTAEDLQPYKEETMEERYEKAVNHVYETEVISFDIAQRDKYELDLQGKFEVVLREGKYYVERIKPQYPKTYEECCKVLGYEPDEDEISCYQGQLIESFVKLLICRDAYWKIAGEQMGLGKPWEPDWKNFDSMKYCIGTDRNIIVKCNRATGNKILAFPTEEIRDAFKENFDGDIDICKEFL